MISWLFLLVLIVAQVLAIRWWLNKEYYPVIFNGWAVALYTTVVLADVLLAWLFSVLVVPSESGGLQILTFLAIAALLIVVFFTFFVRWVIRQDIFEAPVGDKEERK